MYLKLNKNISVSILLFWNWQLIFELDTIISEVRKHVEDVSYSDILKKYLFFQI